MSCAQYKHNANSIYLLWCHTGRSIPEKLRQVSGQQITNNFPHYDVKNIIIKVLRVYVKDDKEANYLTQLGKENNVFMTSGQIQKLNTMLTS